MLKYCLLLALFISSITAQNWAGNYTAVLLDDSDDCPPGNSTITITQNSTIISLTITSPNSYSCQNGATYNLNVTSPILAFYHDDTYPGFAVYFTNNNTILWSFNDGETQWLLSSSNTINTIGQSVNNWIGNWTLGSSYYNPKADDSCEEVTSFSVQSSSGSSSGYADVTICSDLVCSTVSEYVNGGAFYDSNVVNYVLSVGSSDNLAIMNPNGTITWIGGELGLGTPQVDCQFLFVQNVNKGGAILQIVAAFYVILQIIYFI